jgi:hypothetical protein
MKEYMAELITYKLPPLEERIEEFNKMDLNLLFHMNIHTDNLSDYFKNIRNEICKHINYESDDMCKISNNEQKLRRHGYSTGYQQKHVDSNRKCAIAIAVSDFTDPLSFYDFDGDPLDFRNYPIDNPRYRLADRNAKLAYTGHYSTEYPTASNVTTLHNIPENTKNEKRIIFQLCFQIEFEELISKNPDAWRYIQGIRYD